MTYQDETITIYNGMEVRGADDQKVGEVADMRGDHVVVSKGFFFPTDYFIPTSAINTVADGTVYLTVTKDEALNQGWDVEPVFDETVSAEAPIIDAGLQIQNPVPEPTATDAAGVTDLDEGISTEQPLRTDEAVVREGEDTITVPLVEEELTATTRGVERGEVQVEKVVTAEDRTIDVPVTEEHVKVTRQLVDRDADAADQAFEEITIDVPVYGEEVDVEKRAHVVEEVEVARERETRTERVSDTVRREDVRVTDTTTDEVIDEKTPPR